MTAHDPTRRRGERGSVSVEVAVIAPAFIFLLLLVVFAGKVSEADGNVERAAAEGARAASLRQRPDDAVTDAEAAVEANLRQAGVPCAHLTTSVDTAHFEPGGTVTVTVRCEASMADVTLLGVPGTRAFSATSVEVIDTYRSGGP
jgi:Flp pilus assembly protein TadG